MKFRLKSLCSLFLALIISASLFNWSPSKALASTSLNVTSTGVPEYLMQDSDGSILAFVGNGQATQSAVYKYNYIGWSLLNSSGPYLTYNSEFMYDGINNMLYASSNDGSLWQYNLSSHAWTDRWTQPQFFNYSCYNTSGGSPIINQFVLYNGSVYRLGYTIVNASTYTVQFQLYKAVSGGNWTLVSTTPSSYIWDYRTASVSGNTYPLAYTLNSTLLNTTTATWGVRDYDGVSGCITTPSISYNFSTGSWTIGGNWTAPSVSFTNTWYDASSIRYLDKNQWTMTGGYTGTITLTSRGSQPSATLNTSALGGEQIIGATMDKYGYWVLSTNDSPGNNIIVGNGVQPWSQDDSVYTTAGIQTAVSDAQSANTSAQNAQTAAQNALSGTNTIVNNYLSSSAGIIQDSSGNTVLTVAKQASQNALIAKSSADTAATNAANANTTLGTSAGIVQDSSGTVLQSARQAVSDINNAQSTLSNQMNNMQSSLSNSFTNIQNYIAPTLTKVSGYNAATATSGTTFNVSLDYSGANEYQVKVDN